MLDCCVAAADAIFKEKFPHEPSKAGEDLQRYLLKLAKDWGTTDRGLSRTVHYSDN
jgi:hypothetical protein